MKEGSCLELRDRIHPQKQSTWLAENSGESVEPSLALAFYRRD